MASLKPTRSDTAVPAKFARLGADPINFAARRFSRPKPQRKPHLSNADQAALARIASRFAPGAQPAETPEDLPIEHASTEPAVQRAMTAASLPRLPNVWTRITQPGMRTLIAVLILVALLPSVTLGAMLWFGAIRTPGSASIGAGNNAWPPAKSALATTTPVDDRQQSKQAAEIGPLALTAPDTIEAEAGSEVPFAVALDHVGDLPARSIIAIAGLPHGATLSSGRPYGDSDWNLKSDEIGDLRIVLPANAGGESMLRVKLIAPDGEILAGTETVLKVAAHPETTRVTSAEEGAPPSEPDQVYDPNLAGVAAFDEGTQKLLGASGVEETFTESETPPDPPAHVAPAKGAHAADAAKTANAAEAAKTTDDASHGWIAPEFVNLRKGPTSSAEVITVVAKGAKLSVTDRKRGWVKVTDPATSESGWVYAGSKRRIKATDQSGDGSSTSFWPSIGSLLGSD